MMALDKYKSFWSAIALHIHLESWLSQPWLSHTHIREKECTHLHSICSDSNLFHKKKLLLLVNSFCISLPTYFLFLSSLLLINLFTVKSHIIWCITSLARIFPLRLSSKTSLIRKAQSPLSRVIAGSLQASQAPHSSSYLSPRSQWSFKSKPSSCSHFLGVCFFQKILFWSLVFLSLFPSFSHINSIIAAISAFYSLKLF